MFTSEEPTRFKLSCSGSRAMAGALDAAFLDAKKDENGTTFLEVGGWVGSGSSGMLDGMHIGGSCPLFWRDCCHTTIKKAQSSSLSTGRGCLESIQLAA